MKNNEISTLSEFHKMIEKQRSSIPTYRGEGKPTWTLMPKIGRCYHVRKKIDSEPPERVLAEEIVVCGGLCNRMLSWL